MSRTTSNINRAITLAVVTVATAITFSTTASAEDRINRDAREMQRDREDSARDRQRLLQDATEGRDVGRDVDRLRHDQRNSREDRRQFDRDVDQRIGEPGDVDAMARSRSRR
jgi:hypothetical protein